MKRFHRFPASLSFLLLAGIAVVPLQAQVGLKMVGGDHISVTIDGRPFTDFFIGSAYPKPFLAPLRTATGINVTRAYPMETIEGESRDHPHHRGLFIGYGTISGINFWENEKTYKTENRGTITVRKVNEIKPGNKSGFIKASFDWRDPGGALMIDEARTMTFYSEPGKRTIDLEFVFTPKVNLDFVDTKEGFFAIRVADAMAEKNGGKMTNSEGAQTEKNVWGKRANWVDYTGTINGQPVGIAIFDHPTNPNHPPRWHSRAYGLFAVNPFGQKDFDKAAGEGGMKVPAGQVLRFRYRVVIHGGDLNSLNMPDLFNEYVKKVK